MQRLEVSGAVRTLQGSLGVKGLKPLCYRGPLSRWGGGVHFISTALTLVWEI